jgi:hypothetical protein
MDKNGKEYWIKHLSVQRDAPLSFLCCFSFLYSHHSIFNSAKFPKRFVFLSFPLALLQKPEGRE